MNNYFLQIGDTYSFVYYNYICFSIYWFVFYREQTREHAAMLALTCSAPAHPHTPSASFVIELLWIFFVQRVIKQATTEEEKNASAKKSLFLHTTISRKLSISGRIWGLRKSSWLLQPADPLQVCHFQAPFCRTR